MYDLIIIGGGVWGTAAALYAVEHGFGSILLVEANPYVAGESSGKAGGIVSDFVAHPDDRKWVARSRQLFRQAQQASGDTTMIAHDGMLSLCNPKEADQLMAQVAELKARNIAIEVWNKRQIIAHYPDLDRVDANIVGFWTPQDWHVNPTAYAQTTLAMAKAKNLVVHLGYRVQSIKVEDHQVSIKGPGTSLEAAQVLIAAGTWTRKLVQTTGQDIALRPYRAQLASLDFPSGYQLPIVREMSTDMYLVPDGSHNLLAGDGTRLWEHDPDNYQTSGDEQFEAEIATGVMRLISRAHTAQLRRSWAGLCGATPDRRPLIGKVMDRLYIACGDNGFGIKRGPAIGELAVQIAMGEVDAPHLDPHRYPPTDFPLHPGSGGTFTK